MTALAETSPEAFKAQIREKVHAASPFCF